MSDKEGNEGSSADFVCRIPSLPDLDRTFSLDHTNKSGADVIPDVNTAVEPETGLPMLQPKPSSKLPYLDTNVSESIPRSSETKRGFVPIHNSGLSIRNPRDFEDETESTSRQFWNVTRQREIIAKRPKPIYPRGLANAKIAARRHSYHETPSSRTSSVEGCSPPCEVTPSIHSSVEFSPNEFQIQNNLFIPIREADQDFLKEHSAPAQLLLPRTRLDANTTPPPRLNLRPRGKQTSLALDKYFP